MYLMSKDIILAKIDFSKKLRYTDKNLSSDPDAGKFSKVIHNKTLKECARYAKGRVNLNVSKLKRWLSSKDAKLRFNKIDKVVDTIKL